VAKGDSIVGLDVGTTKVVAIVGQLQEGMVQVVGIGKAPNSGMRKGAVVDIEDTVSAISAALDEAERSSGTPIEACIASFGGNQTLSVDSKGVIAVSRGDGEIQEADIERVIEAAQSVALPQNYEVLHIIPKWFTVDGQNGVKDPTGMTGIRLEANCHVIGSSTPALKNFTKALSQTGLEISGIVFSPLASSRAYLTKKQKEIGVIIVDIGASSTSIAVFEEGTVIHSKVIPIGSGHITNDIAIGLKISLDAAEKIKLNEIDANLEDIKDSEKVDLSKYDKNEVDKPNKKYVCGIAEARLNEIFSMVKDELKAIDRDEMLPAGAVFVGGGSKLNGLQQFAKKSLSLPVQIGSPAMELSGIVDKLDDPEYATAVGLMLWGLDETQNIVSNKNKSPLSNYKLEGTFARIKDIFKNFIP
jgi:cell division protein FtsA